MRRREWFVVATCGGIALLAYACGDRAPFSATEAGPDSSIPASADAGAPDAATPLPDAGEPDGGGGPDVDAGPAGGPDSGPVATPDAGSGGYDAGAPAPGLTVWDSSAFPEGAVSIGVDEAGNVWTVDYEAIRMK